MHGNFLHRHFELFGSHLRKDRVAALADFHRAGEHGDFALGIDHHAGGGSRRRARRLLNTSEAFTDFYARLRARRLFAPIDRLGRFDESFFQADGVELLAPIGNIAFDENIFHTNFHCVHAQAFGDLVHLLLASPGSLRNAISTI